MWFALATRTILSVIKDATKNKKRRTDLREKLIEVRDAINELYGLK